MSTSKGLLHAVGVGPGDPDLITLKAIRALNAADVVFAAASPKNDHSLALSIAAAHLKPGVPVVRLDFPMTRDAEVLSRAWETNARTVLEALDAGKNAAFLTLGDPMTYSTCGYLLRTLREMDPAVRVEIVPGVTSYQAAAALAGQTLAESGESFIVLSGIRDAEDLQRGLEVAENAVILKAYRNFPAISQALRRTGAQNSALLISQCGLPGQSVHRGLDQCPEQPPYLSLLLVKRGKS
ncbi:MAG: precorrin-2 C(20)-methyltransferase [Desulfocurvibacter africanus]